MDDFARRLLNWFDQHGRTDLPWQQDIDPYRVWISEIMLQQTQVATVIPYYERFMARFPTVIALAAAGIDEVLHHWTGLGYYARGRNLHRAARIIVGEHDGELPATVAALQSLPGIGRSTAGAIAAIACGVRAPILDGNVKRVLARCHGVAGYPGDSVVAKQLWSLAEAHTPHDRIADYTQAIMDLGATVCTRSNPNCADCPLNSDCEARLAGEIARYPGRKPRKSKPVRSVRLFLVHDGSGACFLEKRPPSGIWGGLWTPPERAADTSPAAFLEEAGLLEADMRDTRFGTPFRHTFTHFHLDIEPVYIELADAAARTAGVVRERDDVRWFRPGANEALGLSAPAVKLLASLTDFGLE